MNAYSEEEKIKIFNDICDLIINGKSLRTALKIIDNPISGSTFFEWIRFDGEKSKQYARATEERAELMFEDMFDIADDSTDDFIQTEGGRKLNSENIQRSKLRVDTRRWALSKMQPKKYGDKLDITSDGEKIEHQQIPLTADQITKAIDNL